MRDRMRWRILLAVLAGIVTLVTSACSTPRIDGGIVGTGNQVDCEARAKKDGTTAPLPEECRREKQP